MGTVARWKSLSALDRSFLVAESRDVMMHVGGLLELGPTEWASPALSHQLRDELAHAKVEPPWNLRLSHPDLLKSPVQTWVPDECFDLDYHFQRTALCSPDERELGMLVSRLHSAPLDLHRPPWEVHFIEGLPGKRIAIYFKVHHSFLDGYTGMRMLARSFSRDPKDRHTPLFFEIPAEGSRPFERNNEKSEPVPTFDALVEAARGQVGVAKDVGRAIVNVVRSRRGDDGPSIRPQAPRSVLNQRVTRSRRFATQRIEIARLKRIAAASSGTVNDVVLAICGVALRRFLLEQDALPERPLVAMVPVNVRPRGDPGGGNALGAILTTLATDEDDPCKALDAVVASTKREKAHLQRMSKKAIFHYSAIVLAPMVLSLLPGAAGRVRPAFNVVISNVPGPTRPLYFRGWRVEESYPLSIPFHGYSLNITVQSYAGSLNFGFIGCRDTIPHLQRLAVYSGEAVEALERRLSHGDIRRSPGPPPLGNASSKGSPLS
jgi:WS/DGAT/MGAT family acyltransferase